MPLRDQCVQDLSRSAKARNEKKQQKGNKMNKAEQTKNKYLKSIFNSIQSELKEIVRQAELMPYSTQNNYGKYLSILTALKPQMGLDNAVQLLIMAGGNRLGILDASKILK
mgnify:FL=1